MIAIVFIYKGSQTKIECEENERMMDIFRKYASKLYINFDVICFSYDGEKIIENFLIKELIKEKEKKTITILVEDINKTSQKSKELISNTSIENESMNNCNENNYILAEFEIKKNDVGQKIRIINSFENCELENKIKEETEIYENEMEIKDNIEIKINNEKISFSYYYIFKKKGKYLIKYSFRKKLIK